MRGRKPDPTAIKLLRNNPGRRPLNHNEPKHAPVDRAVPAVLLADNAVARAALAEWNRVIDTLSQGHVATVDRPTLVAYCFKVGQYETFEALAAAAEPTIAAPSGYPIVNPLIALANKAFAAMIRAAAELGLTPSSRTRVSAAPFEEPKGKGAPVDEFTAFQRKRKTGG